MSNYYKRKNVVQKKMYLETHVFTDHITYIGVILHWFCNKKWFFEIFLKIKCYTFLTNRCFFLIFKKFLKFDYFIGVKLQMYYISYTILRFLSENFLEKIKGNARENSAEILYFTSTLKCQIFHIFFTKIIKVRKGFLIFFTLKIWKIQFIFDK